MGGLTKYTKALTEMRKQMLEAECEDFNQTVKKEGRITGPVNPTVGDVVMITEGLEQTKKLRLGWKMESEIQHRSREVKNYLFNYLQLNILMILQLRR